MLQRIAQTSMNELAAFLTSPEVAPNAPAGPQVAAAPAASSPEAVGIFRIFRPLLDPLPAREAEVAPGSNVPLPPRRPASVAAVPADAAVTLAATGEQ